MGELCLVWGFWRKLIINAPHLTFLSFLAIQILHPTYGFPDEDPDLARLYHIDAVVRVSHLEQIATSGDVARLHVLTQLQEDGALKVTQYSEGQEKLNQLFCLQYKTLGIHNSDGLLQDCSNSSVLTLELL